MNEYLKRLFLNFRYKVGWEWITIKEWRDLKYIRQEDWITFVVGVIMYTFIFICLCCLAYFFVKGIINSI